MQYTWSKEGFTGKKFKKIAVIVVSKDYEVRSRVESKIAQDLASEGFEVVKGISFLGPDAPKENWETKKIGEKLRFLGVDGAIGVTLVNIRDKTELIGGDSYLYPSGYYRYGRYIYTTYDRVYNPSYYKDVKEYIVESNLYDVEITSSKEKALLWKGQSAVHDPTSIQSGAKTYADNLTQYLVKNKIIIPELK
ncbi:hypothetical protein BTO06_14545 [Tenacibaculum sp. SZ-18]|nr:hypothetical protein BTO06_14545 [Tenacibaculum sp. SZ-18]